MAGCGVKSWALVTSPTFTGDLCAPDFKRVALDSVRHHPPHYTLSARGKNENTLHTAPHSSERQPASLSRCGVSGWVHGTSTEFTRVMCAHNHNRVSLCAYENPHLAHTSRRLIRGARCSPTPFRPWTRTTPFDHRWPLLRERKTKAVVTTAGQHDGEAHVRVLRVLDAPQVARDNAHALSHRREGEPVTLTVYVAMCVCARVRVCVC